MARTKPETIPAGDEYIPDVPEAELESMIAAIPSCKDIPKELLILTATLKRKRCGSISGIARSMGRPYATVYGCCACTSAGWTAGWTRYHSTVRGFWTRMPAS